MEDFWLVLEDVLKQNLAYVGEEGELIKAKISADIRNMESRLLDLLLSNEKTKKRFFTNVEGTLVFDRTTFDWIINSKEFLPDSYTVYSNKIALSANNQSVLQNSNVVLDFPYKDAVLAGGQDKDAQEREEIMFHEILAQEEISNMLSPKVLTNARRYNANSDISEGISFDKEDNLVIKGNNLIALSSLLERYKGKVKVIYIDPPYNPKSAANTFAYNNTFNRSTWLTFMKNRLQLAKELLSDDGVIFIDIDHNELFYLGVLADEIFGSNNRIGNLAVVHNLKGRYNGYFSIAHENKIVYAKNAENVIIKELLDDNSKDYPHEDEISNYKRVGLQRTGNGSRRVDRPNLFYPIYYNPETKEISTKKLEGSVEILPIDDSGIERRWRWGRKKVENEWETELEARFVKDRWKLYTKNRIKGDRPKTLWNKPEYSGTTGTNTLKELIGENDFSYPKSVQLVIDSLSIISEEDSIILDFFGGSGTTGQAVLDMNKRDNGDRKFILIEQMDYINTITVPRLSAVINKNDEGSFVFAELKENTIELIREIQAATEKNIDSLKETIYNDERIIPYVTNAVLQEAEVEFQSMDLNRQKNALIKLVDKNKLYVPYSSIDDEAFNITKIEKVFSHSFYEEDNKK